MRKRPGSGRARRKLARLRLEIERAEVALSALRAAIWEARSDEGLAAVQGVRAQNEHLLAANQLVTEEVSAARTALDAAVRSSQTDPLTGLRNRSVLWDRLSHELDMASRQGHRVAVFLLDIDDFKGLNDRRGHLRGDLVLQRVAQVLLDTVRASDTVCRLGGDEFVVVAAAVGRDDVDPLARKIEAMLREPFSLAGQTTCISVSLGVSVFPEDGSAAEELIQRADDAMYRVKRARAVLPSAPRAAPAR